MSWRRVRACARTPTANTITYDGKPTLQRAGARQTRPVREEALSPTLRKGSNTCLEKLHHAWFLLYIHGELFSARYLRGTAVRSRVEVHIYGMKSLTLGLLCTACTKTPRSRSVGCCCSVRLCVCVQILVRAHPTRL